MKLKDFKEYINSLPKELDEFEILSECYDMEKGIILKDVESLETIQYKEKENVYRDSFDGTRYTSIVKEKTFNSDNSKKGLKISFYKFK